MPSKSAPTLRARRSGRLTNEAVSLERTRLVSDPDDKVPVAKSPSPLKSVIWFLVIIVLAFLTYWGLKTYLTDSDNSDEIIEPTTVPTVATEDSVVSLSTLPDNPARPFDDTTFWNTSSKQIQSTATNVKYEINSIHIQPYESYLSIVYEVSGGSFSDFPQVTAEMLSDISLVFENIEANNSRLGVSEEVAVNSNSVNSFTRISFEEEVDSYLVGLLSKQPFALYSKVESEKKYIILDVIEPDDVETTVQPTGMTTPKPTVSVTATPMPPGSQNLTNEFGRNEQKIVTSTTGNTVKITKYNYFDASDKFTYNLVLEGGVPNATVALSGTDLTLKVSNLERDGVVGNGGSGSTDLAATGVTHVQSVEISNTNGESSYVFKLDAARDFRLVVDESTNTLVLEIRN